MSELTQLYTVANGTPPGDCWRTAIACLLDLDRVEDVPHFAETNAADWWKATVRFVEERCPGRTLAWAAPRFPASMTGVVIATGLSPRGEWMHSVLVDAHTGALVWDPHPSRDGLAAKPVGLTLLVTKES